MVVSAPTVEPTVGTDSNDGSDGNDDVEDNKELHGSGVINYRTGIVFLAADMHDSLVGRSVARSSTSQAVTPMKSLGAQHGFQTE